MVVASDSGESGIGHQCLMDTEFQFGRMTKFQRQMVVMVVQQCECTWCHLTVCLKNDENGKFYVAYIFPQWNKKLGDSLAVQWLGLGAFSAGGAGSIPGQGIKILQAMQHGQKKILNKRKF